ncbi:MAG: hypothetical protein H6838_19260 [Planctomycetes bacterium]|nr:hypothetical protein [Planctomycetota bacterium]MCB9887639.1 hypothetical protein [Planctomycetota bacterium]
MRILPPLVAFATVLVPLSAQTVCSAGAAPPTTLATMNPFAGTSLYGHPNFPNSPPPTYQGFSFLIDMQPLVDIEISQIDLDLYDDGNLVQVNPTTTVTSPNQVGATTPVTFYLFPGTTWVGNETNAPAWGPLGTGTLTVSTFHTDSAIVFNPPVMLPAGSWGIAIQVPPTTTGPNPGPLHPMLIPSTVVPPPYTDGVLTMVNVQFQRDSWTASLTTPAHEQSLEFHYTALSGYSNWTAFGAGCGATTPQLGLLSRPIVGTTIDFENSNILAGALVNFWLFSFSPDANGTSLAPFGLPGCNLYLQLSSPITTSASLVTNGLATAQIALPNDPAYAGLVLYAQAAPATASLSFVVSNAVCVAIGLH